MQIRQSLCSLALAATVCLAMPGCAEDPAVNSDYRLSIDATDFDIRHCNGAVRAMLPSLSFATSACADDKVAPNLQYCGCNLMLDSAAGQLDPGPIFEQRGAALLRMGEIAHAIQDYDAALNLQPGSPRALYGRGNAHVENHDYGSALMDYNEALQRQPDFPEALAARCWARAIWHKTFETAVADCDRVLQEHPDNARAREYRGFIFLRSARYAAAIADFDKALAVAHPSVNALYLRGIARQLDGDADRGAADIAQALALDAAVEERYRTFGLTP